MLVLALTFSWGRGCGSPYSVTRRQLFTRTYSPCTYSPFLHKTVRHERIPPLRPFTLPSRQENSRSRRPPRFQILVRFRRFSQRIPLPHARLHLASAQHVEQLGRHLLE